MKTKYTKKGKDSNLLILDDILSSNEPEIEKFIKNHIEEEMGKINFNAPKKEVHKAMVEANARTLVRAGWRFKDKLSPRMQRILEEQHPNPDAA